VAKTTVPIPTRVLVLGMAHDDGTIRADEVYPVAEACGQTQEQVRSCLRRLVSEGLFERQGTGRGAVYAATEAGRTALDFGMQRLRLSYAQDRAGRGWDRRWHLAGFAVPEARRSARDGFRDLLLGMGGAAIQGGLYVSPHAWEDDVRREAKRLGMVDHLMLASTAELEVNGIRDPRELAAMLWPLDAVAARYERFTETHRNVPDALDAMKRDHGRLPDTDFLPLALSMAVSYTECSSRDPYLPPELLPRPWPGRAAREIVVRSRRLALLLREEAGRPALFGMFDEMLETLSAP
jgi:phenylacetic acid degradation operon negative regulatory protein